MRATPDFFSKTLEDRSTDRFWLSRIQTYNWGTYGGVHDFKIAREGFMFVGPSGSGKSTALDAHATLMTPPKWLGYNTAAVGASRQRPDRTLLTYVRGAWGDKSVEEGSLQAEHQYLRRNTTWSVISETYRNADGAVVTLAQVLWVRGTSTASADVKRRYFVLEREFDVREMQPFAESDFNVRQLKARMPEAIVKEEFSGYQEAYRRLLGIEQESALRLLHKTQSAKDLADLNSFLRDFMLDVPETFEIADDLVSQFSELNEAHESVVQAERQIATLQPARDDYDRAMAARRARDELAEILLGIDAHVEQSKATWLRSRIDELAVSITGALEQVRALEESARGERLRLETLESERLGQGGRELSVLEADIADTEALKSDRLRKRDQLDAACRAAGWDLPADAVRMAELAAEAKGLLDNMPERAKSESERGWQLRDAYEKQKEEFAKLRREIDAMRQHSSNIPARLLELRARLCEDLRIGPEQTPFAAELIAVLPEEVAWQGAIERVLRGFATSLLVPERNYRAVSDWINERHLGTRLVYFRMTADIRLSADRPVTRQSLIRKLAFADHPYANWARAELKARFDYACVENMDEFRSVPERAVTLNGQVKHTASRHEKNDSLPIADAKSWVLGFSNTAKLALFERDAAGLGADIARSQQLLAQHEDTRQQSEAQMRSWVTVANTTWSDVDAASIAERVARLRSQLERERESRPDLARLDRQIAQQRDRVKAADKKAADERREADSAQLRRAEFQQRLDALDPQHLSLTLTPTQSEGLRNRFGDVEGLQSVSAIDERARFVERGIRSEVGALTEDIGKLHSAIVNRFGQFIRDWPIEAAGLDASIESAEDFFAKLERLVSDGLPQFRLRFQQLLHDHSAQALSRLALRLDLERAAIAERLELVNESLRTREYNAGTHLEIVTKDRISEDLRAFKADLRAALSNATSNDPAHAEERFRVLTRIVQRLSSADPVDRAWKQQALDVRQHVEFIARELDVSGLEVEVYRGGGGKSGGQRQKLTLFCLAAALRFQLAAEDGAAPKYSTVVIDEAFEKADADFTTLTAKIFESMGFQIVVATPMKAVMALEPFIGGACFVYSPNRKTSATLAIEYDFEAKRLLLDPTMRGEAMAEATASVD